MNGVTEECCKQYSPFRVHVEKYVKKFVGALTRMEKDCAVEEKRYVCLDGALVAASAQSLRQGSAKIDVFPQ